MGNQCSVAKNCLTPKTECWYCDDYNMYQPKNPSVLSPRQERIRLEKKLAKKVKKQTDASKRGKSNRRNGRQAERELVKWLNSQGVDATLVPMSGALKSTNVIAALGNNEFVEKMRGDIKATINGTTYTVESKRDVNTNSLYKKASEGLYHIKGFAYLLRQDLFVALLVGGHLPSPIEVDDKGYKKIHGYFNQDDSDIVVISRPYCDRLFFLREHVYKAILKENNK